jgi:branched-chain amino acid transport system substrate-binding protein
MTSEPDIGSGPLFVYAWLMYRVPVVLAALVLALTSGAAGAGNPYVINVILPLTGSTTFVGKGSREGLQGVETLTNRSGGIDGRPIHFVFQDDQSNPQTTVQLAESLIAKNVPIIMGTASVAGCNALLPLVKNGPLLYCLSPGLHPPDGSYAFSASVSSGDLALVAVRYLRLHGRKRIAIITSTDASGQDAERGIDAVLARPSNKSVTVVDREYFAPTDVDVGAQMARIKASAPQAIITWSTGTPTATVFRAITELGIDVPVLTTPGNATYAQMQQYAGFLPKELLFPNKLALAVNQVTDPGVKAALDSFYATLGGMGIKPDIIPSTTWDPGMIVVAALRKLGTHATAAQLREYIARLRGFAGVTGRYDFVAVPQRGVGASSVVMTRWDPAKGTWIGVSKPGGVPAG